MDDMPTESPTAVPSAKLLSGVRLKLRVGAASLAVLGAGAVLAPQPTRSGVPASEERPVPLLEEELQRRESIRVFRPVREIAARVMPHNVTIPSAQRAGPRTMPDFALTPAAVSRPSGFGVIVDGNGSILTHASALDGRSTVAVQTATGEFVSAQLVAYEASTGLALLRAAAAGVLTAAPISGARPEPGSLAATAARWEGRDIVAPVFVTSAGSTAYSIDAHGAALGGIALYNLEGEAFAIAAGANQGMAFPLRDAIDRLTTRAASRRLDASIGVMFQPISGSLLRVFDRTGALVSRAFTGGPADVAGMAPGDLLVSVATTAVDSPEAAQNAIAALTPGVSTTVGAVRDRRPLTFTVVPGSAFDLAARAARPLAQLEGVRAESFLSAQTLQSAGIAPDAMVVAIDGRAVSSRTEAVREWGRRRPVALLYLQHQNEQFFAAVGEPR